MWWHDVLSSTTHYNHTFMTCGQHDALSSTTHYNPTFMTCGRHDALSSTTCFNPTFKTCGGLMSYPQPHIITPLLRHVVA